MDPLRELDLNRRVCTGSGLNYQRPPDTAPTVVSWHEFDSVVTEYYKFFNEAITADVAFLQEVEKAPEVESFRQALYQLRTAKQHDDNVRAVRFYRNWVAASKDDCQVAATTLASALTKALQVLAKTSARVRTNSKLKEAWLEHASAEPATIFDAVCADLNVSFYGATRAHLIRQVEYRKKKIPQGRNVRREVESICVEQIVGQANHLAVPYHEVLDYLGLVGSHRARAAILVAYSVSASTNLRGDAYLERVRDAWIVSSA